MAVFEAPSVALYRDKVHVDMITISFTIFELNAEQASCLVACVCSSLGDAIAILISSESVSATNHLRSHVNLDRLTIEEMLLPNVDLEVVLLVDVKRHVDHFVVLVCYHNFVAIGVVQILVLIDFCAANNMLFVFPGRLEAAV